MKTRSDSRKGHEGFFHAFFLLIILVTASGRLYQLGSPSMWYDEILLPISVSSPWSYFYKWLINLEVHPPLPYLLVKGMLLAGASDFMLRLPFCLAGIASIYAVYRVARSHFGTPAALVSACFLTASPLHLYLSMAVRPYTFIVLAALLLMHVLLEYRSSGKQKFIYWTAFFNSLIFSLHYIGIFLFFPSAMILVLFSSDRSKIFPSLLRFLAATLLFSAPTAFFFLQMIAHRASGSFAFPLNDYLVKYAWSVAGIFDFSTLPGHAYQPMLLLYRYLFPSLCLLGAASSLFKRQAFLQIWLCFLLVPWAMIAVLRFNLQVTPWHISFLLPVFAVLAGIGAGALPWKRSAACLILLSTVWSVVSFMRCEECHTPYAYGGPYKSMAEWLVPLHRGDNKALLAEEMTFHSLNWYAEQQLAPDSLPEPKLTPGRNHVECTALTNKDFKLGHYFDGLKDVSKAGPSRDIHHFPNWNAVSWLIPAHSTHGVSLLPYTFTLTPNPEDLLAHAYESRGLLFFPFWGRGWMPSSNRSPARVEFAFESEEARSNVVVSLNARYHLSGQGNAIIVLYRFDDEDWFPVRTLEAMPAPTTKDDFPFAHDSVSYQRLTPFHNLRVAFELICPQTTPRYDGGNLSNTVLNGFSLNLDPITQDLFSLTGKIDSRINQIGFYGVEQDGPLTWRWASGPSSSLDVDLLSDGPVSLAYAFHNYIPGQNVILLVNGAAVREYNGLGRAKWLDESVRDAVAFNGRKGRNTISFQFSKWNGYPERYLQDSGDNSVAFTQLELNF